MKKKTAVIVAVVLGLGVALALALDHHTAGARKVSSSACETRMREDYVQGVTRTSRPAECRGVSTAKLQQIAGSVMSTALPEAAGADDTAYLKDLEALEPGLTGKRSSRELDSLGQQVCDALSSGSTEVEALTRVMGSGLTDTEAASVTAAAERDYCPQ